MRSASLDMVQILVCTTEINACNYLVEAFLNGISPAGLQNLHNGTEDTRIAVLRSQRTIGEASVVIDQFRGELIIFLQKTVVFTPAVYFHQNTACEHSCAGDQEDEGNGI